VAETQVQNSQQSAQDSQQRAQDSQRQARIRELEGEVERFRRASEDALQQLDWCIGYGVRLRLRSTIASGIAYSARTGTATILSAIESSSLHIRDGGGGPHHGWRAALPMKWQVHLPTLDKTHTALALLVDKWSSAMTKDEKVVAAITTMGPIWFRPTIPRPVWPRPHRRQAPEVYCRHSG
jgi:hypothetical protein